MKYKTFFIVFEGLSFAEKENLVKKQQTQALTEITKTTDFAVKTLKNNLKTFIFFSISFAGSFFFTDYTINVPLPLYGKYKNWVITFLPLVTIQFIMSCDSFLHVKKSSLACLIC